MSVLPTFPLSPTLKRMNSFLLAPMSFQTFSDKENLWRKNEIAHQRMREKSKSAAIVYCAECCHHRCGDPLPVLGSRSLKKSKVCVNRTTKIDRARWGMDPTYLNIRAGETTHDDTDLPFTLV